MRALPLLIAAFACSTRPATPRVAVPAEGISIAIYASDARSYGVVDDRRWIEVAGDSVLLDRIDPAAALQSLVIEPLGQDPIDVVACVRERIDDSAQGLAALAEARGERPKRVIVLHGLHDPSPQRYHYEDTKEMEPAIVPGPSVLSPIVRCRVKARAGKHLVRVLHVTSSLAFRTEHSITMKATETHAERATLATRFAILTPNWRERAEVTLFEGLPGDETPPQQLVHAPIVLDGSTSILGGEPREVAARLRTIYDGTKPENDGDVKPNDIVWGRESRRQVWVWLELTEPLKLSSGPVRAHVALPNTPPRDLEIAAELRQKTGELTRWPLWIDEDLLGSRRRTIDRADGVTITDRVQLSVSNLGTQSREVWIEERLRPAKRRTLGHAWPKPPTMAKSVARTKLVLSPGQTERLGFTIDYEF